LTGTYAKGVVSSRRLPARGGVDPKKSEEEKKIRRRSNTHTHTRETARKKKKKKGT
jgi:hypothetical protein